MAAIDFTFLFIYAVAIIVALVFTHYTATGIQFFRIYLNKKSKEFISERLAEGYTVDGYYPYRNSIIPLVLVLFFLAASYFGYRFTYATTEFSAISWMFLLPFLTAIISAITPLEKIIGILPDAMTTRNIVIKTSTDKKGELPFLHDVESSIYWDEKPDIRISVLKLFRRIFNIIVGNINILGILDIFVIKKKVAQSKKGKIVF